MSGGSVGFKVLILAAGLATTAVACAAPDLQPVRPHAVGSSGKDDSSKKDDDFTPSDSSSSNGNESTTPGAPAPAPEPTDTIWRGTLAKTPTVVFGGNGYCTYKVTYTDITMKLVMSQDGVVKSSEVIGRMMEEAPDCPHPTIPNNLNTFNFMGDSRAGLDVSLKGIDSNKPKSNLAFEGATDVNNTISGTIRIHRTDIGNPFDWTVVANIKLTQATE